MLLKVPIYSPELPLKKVRILLGPIAHVWESESGPKGDKIDDDDDDDDGRKNPERKA